MYAYRHHAKEAGRMAVRAKQLDDRNKSNRCSISRSVVLPTCSPAACAAKYAQCCSTGGQSEVQRTSCTQVSGTLKYQAHAHNGKTRQGAASTSSRKTCQVMTSQGTRRKRNYGVVEFGTDRKWQRRQNVMVGAKMCHCDLHEY